MRSNDGSAIIAALGLGFVLTVMMLALALTVNMNYELAGATGRSQRLQFGMEQMAERTMARLLPEVRWDGTFDRWGLNESRVLTDTFTANRCTVQYTADVAQIDAGVIHVTAVEECAGQAGRQVQMSYLMSPDFTHVQAIGEHGERLLPEGNPIAGVSVCSTSTGGGGFTTTVRVSAREAGYVRLYAEGALRTGSGEAAALNPMKPRVALAPDIAVSPGATVSRTFVDPFGGDGDRRLNVLFSRERIPEDGRVRGACPDGSCDAVAARAVEYGLHQGCAGL